jgi:Calcineurin-like phosphoesterase
MILRLSLVLALAGVLVAGAASSRAAPELSPPRAVANADAYVSASAARRNFGGARFLRIQGKPSSRAYIRFDLRGLGPDAVISSATLRLYSRSSKGRFSVHATQSSWSERRITFRNAPRLTRRIVRSVRVRRGLVRIDVTRGVTPGKVVSFALTTPRGIVRFASRESIRAPRLDLVLVPAETLLAAGDIGDCASTADEATAALIDGIPGTVAALGDLAYENGTLADFNNCYQPSWGRFKARTRPAPGNHEYETGNASGYFAYWGATVGNPAQGWYSYDLGAWHIVSLNSNCQYIGGCSAGSPEVSWLRADLAAHKAKCTLAYWHHPFFSGGQVTNDTELTPLWQTLYAANADVVLSGHAHNYQRFAPQNVFGVADSARGLREFVVGTGGNHQLHPVAAIANTEVMNNTAWGVLQLTLRPRSYDWRFLPIAGQAFTDSGSQACH